MKISELKKDEFKTIVNNVYNKEININYLYDNYLIIIEEINNIIESNENTDINNISHYKIILYLISDFIYLTKHLSEEELDNFYNDENKTIFLASIVCDKYITNEHMNYQTRLFYNKYSPEISTLYLYVNFLLQSCSKLNPDINNLEYQVIYKLIFKSLGLSKCIIDLILNGNQTEAFSTSRTLHETECILLCLTKHPHIIKTYLKHIRYSLAFRGLLNKEETDLIFLDIKKEMKENNLKSKDMKKYIEYGYLYTLDVFNELQLKLNFRDGIQKAVGLEQYSKIYEMSSEIAHSSPILLLSDNRYFSEITLLNLYESFFRIEKIFYNFYKDKVSNDILKRYEMLQNMYLSQLSLIYNEKKDKFIYYTLQINS